MKKLILYNLIALSFSYVSINATDFIYHGHDETVRLIQSIIGNKEKGAYLRIGDGDTSLAAGLNSGTHAGNSTLQQEEQQVLALERKNIIKTLPLDPHLHQKDINTYDAHLSPDRIKFIIDQAKPLWGNDRTVYSPHFLSHYAITDIPRCMSFLTFLKQTKSPLLIGNEKISSEIRNLLFGPQCAFIATPARNAYADIQRIEDETLNILQQLDPNSYHVIMLSSGNTGRVLTKRIYDKVGDNFFFFDFGSLMDAICGFKTRIWIRTYFNYDLFYAELKKSLETI